MHTACKPDGHVQKPDRQPIGMSGGIAEQAESGKNWSDLVKLADNSMYQGRRSLTDPVTR